MSVRLRLTLLQTLLLGLVLTAFAVIVYAAISSQEMSQLNYDLRLHAEDVQQRALGVRVLHARRDEVRPSVPVDAPGSQSVPAEPDRPDRSFRHVDLPAVMAQGLPLPTEDLDLALNDRLEGSTFLAQLVTSSGKVVGHTTGFDQPLALRAGFWGDLATSGAQTSPITLSGEQYQMLATPVQAGPVADHLTLVVLAPLASIEATLATWRVTLALIVLGTVAVSAGIAWFMATRALRPVDRMASAARTIGNAADFTRRIPEPEQTDELGRLARTFNEMLDQLAAANDTQRRFLADASHELRTPLTVIGTNTSALLRGGGEDPVERAETLQAISRETQRMSRLVADLLALARSDAGQRLVLRPIALDEVVLDVYQQQQSVSGAVALELGEWEQVAVEADPDRLKQVVLNLVDNAVRHTPAGGTVTLDVQSRRGEAVVSVRDTSTGIPADQQEQIFERFYRIDQPRNRQVGGTGLGLAIAREMAIAHGGRIELESVVGKGSTFSLILPARCSASVAPATSRPTRHASPEAEAPLALPVPNPGPRPATSTPAS